MNSLSRKFRVLGQPLSHACHADCHVPGFEKNADMSMESGCGPPNGKIVRGDAEFNRYHLTDQTKLSALVKKLLILCLTKFDG